MSGERVLIATIATDLAEAARIIYQVVPDIVTLS